MNKIHCSVPILTLNAEKYLARCLESLKNFEDVFIVDGNSTDGTHEIARRYGVPIYKQVETDEPNVRIKNFTEVRSRAYDRAKTNWILVLDSDEYITPMLEESIRSALSRDGGRSDIAFLIEKKLSIAGKEIDYAFFREIAVRLYNRKSGIGYRKGKVVHEKLAIPEGVVEELLRGVFFSEEIPTYGAGIKKDDYYLSLVWQRMQMKRVKGADRLLTMLWNGIESMLRAVKILVLSVLIYLRHGYAHSLPLTHVVRHARYHLRMAVLRVRHVVLHFTHPRSGTYANHNG